MCQRIYKRLAYGVAKEMIEQLKANSHKGDRPNWVNLTSQELSKEIDYHNLKLAKAIEIRDLSRIKEYSADIANLCGMILDVEKIIDLDWLDPHSRTKQEALYQAPPTGFTRTKFNSSFD